MSSITSTDGVSCGKLLKISLPEHDSDVLAAQGGFNVIQVVTVPPDSYSVCH